MVSFENQSPEASALWQQVQSLMLELEESAWFENHAYRLIEHLESLAQGQDLQAVLARMLVYTDRSVAGASGVLQWADPKARLAVASPQFPQGLLDWMQHLPSGFQALVRTQAQFPGESVECFKDLPEPFRSFALWSAPLGPALNQQLGSYSLALPVGRELSRAERIRLERAARLLGMAVERDQLQSALRQSEQHFRQLVVDSQVAICRRDDEGRLLYANPSWYRLTGLSTEQLGQSLQQLFPQIDREQLGRLALLRREGSASSLELQLGDRVVWVTGGPLGQDGSLETWIDVTEENHLRFQNRRLAAALEQSSEGVLIVDVLGQIEYTNAALTRSLGFTPEELVGLPLQAIFTPEIPYPEVFNRVESTHSWTGLLKATRRNGTSYVGEAVIAFLKPHSGQGVNLLISCRDVTREVELEEQVRMSQKLEAVGLLAGGVAHDFNNLLQAMGGFASLCRDPELSESERDAMLAEIVSATERAGQLTRQLLSFARRQPTQKGLADLSEVVGRLLCMTRRLIGPQIELHWSPSPVPVPVSVDPAQIEQLLMNLCVNARDAMPRGGQLKVSVCRVSEPPDPLSGPCARLEVEDTGAGIDSQHLPRLFEPFFTTKNQGEGTGLGLSVVYGIVQSHEGQIEVQSRPGLGTSFRICLPLHSGAATVQTSPAPPKAEPHPPLVLVVDDEPKLLNIAVKVFERAGFQVLTASNGVEAEEVFLQHRDHIDAVMLDLIMPRRGGLETWHILENLRPGLPVLFCSGYMQDAIEKIPNREHISILSKPYGLQRLVEEMKRVLAASAPRAARPI